MPRNRMHPTQVSIDNPDDINYNDGTLPVIKLRQSPNQKTSKANHENFNTIDTTKGRAKSLIRNNKKNYGLH